MGDLIYGLSIMRYFGGGEFYLHLHQVDWIGQHYYGAAPTEFHRGRMTEQDLESLRPLLESQSWCTRVAALDPGSTEITHDLDRFRPIFRGHPGNYIDCYCQAFGISDFVQRTAIRTTPWITGLEPLRDPDRPIVVNRTDRWQNPQSRSIWQSWLEEGRDEDSLFVGTEQEYERFREFSGWRWIRYQPTRDCLELAQWILGAGQFVGNQSLALSLAVAQGVCYACEARADLPRERNECWFPDQPGGEYF